MVEDCYVELRGLRLHYRDWGGKSSVPMVLLHGLASQSHIFDLVAPLLAKNFRVVALDQRGHGESSRPEAGYDMDSVARDLRAFLDAIEFEHAVIVGHSWGGNVALQFGAQCPERAAALVLVDGGFIDLQSNPEMTWERTRKMLAPPNFIGTRVDDFKKMIKEYTGEMWKPAIEQIILQNFEVLPDQTIRPRLSFENHVKVLRGMWAQRPTQLYSQIHCPVLMIPARTEKNDEHARAFLEQKRRTIAAADAIPAPHEVVWFDETIHDIPLQRPRKLANVITRFVREYGL